MSDEIPENIDRFNRITLALLHCLYENFPGRIDIDLRLLGAEVSGDEFADGDSGRERAYVWMDAAADSVRWLVEEGFIRSEGRDLEDGESQVVLSAKGFEALGQVPAAIKDNPKRKSIGAVAGDVAKAGAKEIASSLVKELLAVGMRAAMGA